MKISKETEAWILCVLSIIVYPFVRLWFFFVDRPVLCHYIVQFVWTLYWAIIAVYAMMFIVVAIMGMIWPLLVISTLSFIVSCSCAMYDYKYIIERI